MPQSLPQRQTSPKVPEFDRGGLRPAKARLSSEAFPLGAAMWECLLKGHESVKAMAYAMGQTDRSLLRRQIEDGTITLKKLLQAEPKALACFGEFLIEHFGDAKKSKGQIAREKLPELLAAILDLVDGQEPK